MKLFDTILDDSRDLVNSEYVIGCVVGVIKLAMSGCDSGDDSNESVVAVDMIVWEGERKRGVGGEWGGGRGEWGERKGSGRGRKVCFGRKGERG